MLQIFSQLKHATSYTIKAIVRRVHTSFDRHCSFFVVLTDIEEKIQFMAR